MDAEGAGDLAIGELGNRGIGELQLGICNWEFAIGENVPSVLLCTARAIANYQSPIGNDPIPRFPNRSIGGRKPGNSLRNPHGVWSVSRVAVGRDLWKGTTSVVPISPVPRGIRASASERGLPIASTREPTCAGAFQKAKGPLHISRSALVGLVRIGAVDGEAGEIIGHLDDALIAVVPCG